MSRAAKTYSIDHPKIRTTRPATPYRHPSSPVPHAALGLLRADRDRLPRWG